MAAHLMIMVDTSNETQTIEHEGKVYAEVNADGRVLYDDDGKEFAFDAADTYAKIDNRPMRLKAIARQKNLQQRRCLSFRPKCRA